MFLILQGGMVAFMKKLLSIALLQIFVLVFVFAAKINSTKGYADLSWGSTITDAKKAGYKLSPIDVSENLYIEPVEAFKATTKDKAVSVLQLYYYNGRLFFVSETLSSNDFSQQKLEARYGNFNKQGIYLAGKQYIDAEREIDGLVTNLSIVISNSTGNIITKMYDWNVYKNISVTGIQLSKGQNSKTSKTALETKMQNMAEEIASDLVEANAGMEGKPVLVVLSLTTDDGNENVEEYVTNALTREILKTRKITIVPRTDEKLDKILKEIKFQESDRVDQKTTKFQQIGNHVGANFICDGTIKDLGNKLAVTASVYDVEKAVLCSMPSTTITKDDYLKDPLPKKTVSVQKQTTNSIAQKKTVQAATQKTAAPSYIAWKVKTHEDTFLDCTYYTFIVNSSDKEFMFINYKKAENPANSRVIVGIHWTDENYHNAENNGGTYEIKGSNGKMVTKNLVGYDVQSDKAWYISTFYYAWSPKESARWLVEIMKNSDSVAVRRDGLTRRFQTAGLVDKMAEYGIFWTELSSAIANEEF